MSQRIIKNMRHLGSSAEQIRRPPRTLSRCTARFMPAPRPPNNQASVHGTALGGTPSNVPHPKRSAARSIAGQAFCLVSFAFCASVARYERLGHVRTASASDPPGPTGGWRFQGQWIALTGRVRTCHRMRRRRIRDAERPYTPTAVIQVPLRAKTIYIYIPYMLTRELCCGLGTTPCNTRHQGVLWDHGCFHVDGTIQRVWIKR